MPEITKAEQRELNAYQALGTPREIKRKIDDLEKDNKKQRDELKETKNKLPKDGEVIVKQEEKDELDKYVELGKPDELKSKVEKGDQAQTKLEQLETRNAASAFAKVAGIHEDAVDTLTALPALEGAKFEVRKVKVDDKEQEVAYLTLAGEGNKAMPYEDAKEKVSALKGLRAAEGDGQKFIRQGGPSKSTGGSGIYDRIRKAAKDRQEAKTKTNTATAPRDALMTGLGMR